MQIMVIRIGEVAEESGSRYYPLSLHVDDGNTPDWAEQPATTRMDALGPGWPGSSGGWLASGGCGLPRHLLSLRNSWRSP
jgi:hypothetical protein